MTIYINGTSGISGVDGSAGTPAIQGTDPNTGISFPAADTIAFNEGGAEAARIDSSGRFLVGTSSARSNFFNLASTYTPSFQLESTTGASGGSMASLVSSSANAFGAYLVLGHQRSGTIGGNTIVNSGDTIGAVSFHGSDGSEFVEAAYVSCEVDGTPGANDMPGRLVFSTTADGASSPTERMRINSAGATYTYNNAGATALYAATSAGNDTTVVFVVQRSATSIVGGTDAYYIRANGSAGSASNINLKKNIETTRDGYLEDLNRLRVVKYNWNDQEDTEPRELGLIAQEVEKIFPGLVCDMSGEDENGKKTTHKGIVYSVLPVMLLKALQEADAKIQAQSTSIASLEARLAALEARLS